MVAFLPLHDCAVCWPTEDEKWEASNWVKSVSCEAWCPGFAMVDGMLIPLHTKPSHYGNQFFDRKSQYSLNVQVHYPFSIMWTHMLTHSYSLSPSQTCICPWPTWLHAQHH